MVVLCSLGSKNAKGTSAEPGCHGYTKWRGEKYGARLPTWQQDRAIERLNELVSGGMDAAVLRPSAREVAKKLIAREEAKYSCPGAQKACIACVKRMCASWTAANVEAARALLACEGTHHATSCGGCGRPGFRAVSGAPASAGQPLEPFSARSS